MRVLQVLGRSAGGIARHVAHLTTALRDRDWDVDVASPSGLPIPLPHRVATVEIPDDISRGHVAAALALRRLAGGYDIVHAHGLRAGVDAAAASRWARIPCVITVHNTVQPEIAGARTALYRRAEGLVVRLGHQVLAVSEEIARRLEDAAPRHASKVDVVYLGVASPSTPKRSAGAVKRELDAETGLIVTASRLAPQKALDVMIEAVRRMEHQATLAIFGEGPLEGELRRDVAQAGLSDRVRFMGFRDDLADYVAAAEAFCLSSIWEGIPLAVQEAMLLGTPVVATRVGGMPEIVDHEGSGLLVPPNDPAALARALDRVMGDAAERDRLARNARASVAERFSTARMLDRIEETYRALVA